MHTILCIHLLKINFSVYFQNVPKLSVPILLLINFNRFLFKNYCIDILVLESFYFKFHKILEIIISSFWNTLHYEIAQILHNVATKMNILVSYL